jgi:hypothetical protein
LIEVTANGRLERVVPVNFWVIDSGAAPFGGVALMVPLPAVRTP